MRHRIVIPFADEPGFYSEDEMADLVGHAIEKFEAHVKDKPTHQGLGRSDQHDLGEVLRQIDKSKAKRKNLGGPAYHQGLSISGISGISHSA